VEYNTADHLRREGRLCDRTCSIATRSHPHTASADTSHSSLTHLGEQGASLLMLMAKSRHKKPENVRRYFKPSPEAIAELTSLLAPGDGRR
jgi:phage terminase small subunit